MVKKLTTIEYKRWCGFRKPGGHKLARCKVNQFNWSTANSLKHEVAKFTKLYELVSLGHACVTEAVPCGIDSLRHDLIDLTDDVVYEFECDRRRARRFEEMKDVEVILV